MWHINNLHGEIVYENDRLCSFDVTRGQVTFSDVNDKIPLPFEMRKGVTNKSIMDFLLDRVTDENRQDLAKMCEEAGIECSAEGLIGYNHGLMLDDKYWIRTEDGPQTRNELLKLMGFYVSEAEEVHAFS